MGYMVTYRTRNGEKSFALYDKWQDVLDWEQYCDEGHGKDWVQDWTVSMVLKSTASTVPPNTREEKGAWFDNLVSLMPEKMNNTEIMATIMTVATHYWDEGDLLMGLGFLADTAKQMVYDEKTHYEH